MTSPDYKRRDRVLAAVAVGMLIARLAAWAVRFDLGAEVACLLASWLVMPPHRQGSVELLLPGAAARETAAVPAAGSPSGYQCRAGHPAAETGRGPVPARGARRGDQGVMGRSRRSPSAITSTARRKTPCGRGPASRRAAAAGQYDTGPLQAQNVGAARRDVRADVLKRAGSSRPGARARTAATAGTIRPPTVPL